MALIYLGINLFILFYYSLFKYKLVLIMLNKRTLFGDFLLKYWFENHFRTNWRNRRPFSRINGVSQESEEMRKYCDILNLSYDFDETELRQAYLGGCRRTHPDGNTESTDKVNSTEEFHSIESAYNRLKDYLKTEKTKQTIDSSINSNEEEEENRLKHKVPQHRQYLSFDGIGFGTPTERQKQYQKHKLTVATNRVNDFQLNQIKSNHGLSEKNAIVLKDPNIERQIKTKQGFDRLIEDLIQESMARGEFKNLSGYGKPLKNKAEYPYLDFTTYKLNEILINNGFVPEWVLLEREIREERKSIKNKLFCLKNESKLDNISIVRQLLTEKVTKVNKMIDKYNRIVPILTKQQTLINLEKEVNKINNIDQNIGAFIERQTNNSSENLNFNSNDKRVSNNFEEKVKNEKKLFKKLFSLFS